jgi:hypothetical protein
LFDTLTAFVSFDERIRRCAETHDLALRNSRQLHKPRQIWQLMHIAATLTPVL